MSEDVATEEPPRPPRQVYMDEYLTIAEALRTGLVRNGVVEHVPGWPTFGEYVTMREERTWGRFAASKWGMETIELWRPPEAA